MSFGLPGFMDMITDSNQMSLLVPLTIICIGGGLPYLRERRRLKKIEKGLPELLEGISTNLGAGLGLQQAITTLANQRDDLLGKYLRDAVARSQATSFDAALSEFAVKTRSSSVQRAINLLQTADANEAPLQDVTFSMSMEYDRLHRLRYKRISDLSGHSMTMQMLMCFLLPGTIGVMFGLFAGPTAGIPMGLFHPTMMFYMAAGAAFSTLSGAVMLGRSLGSAIWWIPPWALFAQIVYMGSYLGAGVFG